MNSEQRIELELVDCKDMAPGGIYADKALVGPDLFAYENILKGRKEITFLCPLEPQRLGLEGNFGMETFEYV